MPTEISGGFLPLRITSLDQVIDSLHQVDSMIQRYNQDQYMINVKAPSERGGTFAALPNKHLQDDAQAISFYPKLSYDGAKAAELLVCLR
jgi:hypothetical protein